MGGNNSSMDDIDVENETAEEFDARYKFHPSLSAAEAWYPPPRQARTPKYHVFEPIMLLDAGRKVHDISDTFLDDYDELAANLTDDCHTDMERLCAIFAFIALECLGDKKFDARVRRETPRAYMKSIKDGYGRYAYYFTLLCRKAGIACVLIPGIAKTSKYKVGQADFKNMRNVWTAVFVGGDWRFVHPSWAFQTNAGDRAMDLAECQGWDPDDLSDGQGQDIVNIMNKVNHFWFLTDAERFITFCLPDDPRWQLLKNHVNVEQYTRLLCLTSSYFDMGLRIINQNKCHIITTSGFIEISMQVPEDVPCFTVSYDFARRMSNAKVDETATHCVAMIKDNPLVKFKLRLPFADTFIFRIFGSDVEQPKHLFLLASFRIDCNKAIKYFMPFPESPYYGWGAGYETERCGVTAMSHTGGLINVTSPKPLVMKFKLKPYVELVADLLDATEKFEPTFTKIREYTNVLVKLPQVNKEYGLILYAKNTHSGLVCNAVNYIIRRDVPADRTKKEAKSGITTFFKKTPESEKENKPQKSDKKEKKKEKKKKQQP